MAGERHLTRDHERIRRWAEQRGGRPAAVVGTAGGDGPGAIRIELPHDAGEATLEEIGWEEWFARFDAANLVLLHEETTPDGDPSDFNELVRAEAVAQVTAEPRWSAGGGTRTAPANRRGTRRTRRSPTGSRR